MATRIFLPPMAITLSYWEFFPAFSDIISFVLVCLSSKAKCIAVSRAFGLRGKSDNNVIHQSDKPKFPRRNKWQDNMSNLLLVNVKLIVITAFLNAVTIISPLLTVSVTQCFSVSRWLQENWSLRCVWKLPWIAFQSRNIANLWWKCWWCCLLWLNIIQNRPLETLLTLTNLFSRATVCILKIRWVKDNLFRFLFEVFFVHSIK